MSFGQVVIGPPGSGKTTYCATISKTYKHLGRECLIVNLDPANTGMADIDIKELITIADIMENLGLGPNGAILYAMEYLEQNMDWLIEKLASLAVDKYVVFDLPGQVELFTHHASLKNVLERLVKLNYRLCVVQLVDAHYCTDPGKYISVLMQTLKMMIQLELPHINILSKIDLLESYGTLAFNLDFYTDVQDLDYLLHVLDEDSQTARYASLNKAICTLIGEFSLVSFYPVCIDDPETVVRVLRVVDKANGYVFGGLENSNESIFAAAARDVDNENVLDVAERYLRQHNVEKEEAASQNAELEREKGRSDVENVMS